MITLELKSFKYMGQKEQLIHFRRITLERTACFGECPVYTLEFLADGTVNYYGEMFVEKTGEHTWKIDQKAINKLNEAIGKYNYFELEEDIPEEFSETTCQPSCITSVELQDGTYRKIHNDYGSSYYPKELKRFEDLVDEVAGS